MKSWKTAVTRARHESSRDVAKIDAVDLDRARLRVVQPAQQLGERRLAGAVLPDDGERRAGGNGEIEVVEDRAQPPGYAKVRSRKRISRAGTPVRRARSPDGERAGRPPSPARAAAPRRPAPTAPSSAQLSPPNAIIDAPTALCANTTTCAEVEAAVAAALRERPEHDDVGADDEQQAPEHRLLAQPRRLVLQLVQPRAARDEAIDRPVGEAEQAQLLRRRRIDREPVRVVGVALRAAHLLGVAVAPDRALAQQPVRGEPGAAEHERRPPRVGERARTRRRGRRSSRPGRRR